MNKQPFYHRAVVIFTGTRDVSDELQIMLRTALEMVNLKDTIIVDSLVVEECDAEPGDPADLVE